MPSDSLELTIRMATPADAEGMVAIYAPVVRETAISFEVEPPTVEEFGERIERNLARYPWLVACHKRRLLGYAYATEHRARAAYRWSAESSVYIDAEARGRGVGRRLYQQLLDRLQALGFANVYAGMTLPNDASQRLHRSVGFQSIGVFPRIGYKFGRWHDVAWWHRPLVLEAGDPLDPPRTPEQLDGFSP